MTTDRAPDDDRTVDAPRTTDDVTGGDVTSDDQTVTRADALQQLETTQTTSARRGFLRGAAATALAAAGFGGTAAALEPDHATAMQHAMRPYESREAAFAAVRDEGADLLAVLEARGYIERASPAALAPDGFDVHARIADETPTARLEVTTTVDGDRLHAVVEPQTGDRYAVVGEGEETTILDPTVEGDVVTESCSTTDVCLKDEDGLCNGYHLQCCDTGCYRDGRALIRCSADPDDCPTYCESIC